MKINNKTFYLTTTLPYVNAPLHMGHALEFVRADIIARYKKALDYDVYFNTGTDEHGMKIFEKAKESGMSVQDFVDKSFLNFRDCLGIFGTSKDVNYIRTTDKKHEKIAQSFWLRCLENGYIYKKNYEAKYCVGCESEKTDSDLVGGECPDHPGRDMEIIQEENYFFKYSAFEEKLLDFYKNNSRFVIPDFRFNEIKSFVERGLQDFSISRLKDKMPWGISVPNDENHVMYVWFDALTNYISTLADEHVESLDDLLQNENFKKYWINGNPTQYCGKDNLRFQSAMWQAMLMAAEVPNSKQIVINGFVMGDGGVKMSKTLGNVVDPKNVVEEYGTDALRLFLAKEISPFEDSPFGMERFKDAYNANLANGLGNLVSRILQMSSNYGVSLKTEDLEIKYFTEEILELENFDITKFTNNVWVNIKSLNEFIQDKEPFKKIKTNETEAKADVYFLLKGLFDIALSLGIIIPETAEKIKELIKENKKPENPLFLRK